MNVSQNLFNINYGTSKRILVESIEHSGQIPLTRVGQQHHHFLSSIFRTCSHLSSGKSGGS